jgi:chitin synthase
MHQQLEAVTDLSALSPVSDDIIVSCIRERFMSDQIYTSVGTSALVAVNPHKYVPTNSDSVMHKYAAEYRDTSDTKEISPPHIFQLANNAYYHMRRTSQDQSVVLRWVLILWAGNPSLKFIHVVERRGAVNQRTAGLL